MSTNESESSQIRYAAIFLADVTTTLKLICSREIWVVAVPIGPYVHDYFDDEYQSMSSSNIISHLLIYRIHFL